MTDKQITDKFKVPQRTLSDWKKRDKDNWRYILYILMKNYDD